MVLFCLKCICLERLANREDMGQGSGVGEELRLLMNSAHETEIANAFPVWGWPLAALSQVFSPTLSHLPYRYVLLVTRISKRKSVGKMIMFTCH